jgi:hypothetical protein
MTVGEQVAIEAALAGVADTLVIRGGTVRDTLLAGFVRIAGRLAGLQGRQGTVVVTGPDGVPEREMHAVALVSVDRSAPTPDYIHVVVAWEGLDIDSLVVRRAIVLMAPGGTERAGTFPIDASAPAAGSRYVDFTAAGGATVSADDAGTLTVEAPSFGGSCPGLRNTSTNRCAIGRETVSATFQAGTAVSWPAATLPAFELQTY